MQRRAAWTWEGGDRRAISRIVADLVILERDQTGPAHAGYIAGNRRSADLNAHTRPGRLNAVATIVHDAGFLDGQEGAGRAPDHHNSANGASGDDAVAQNRCDRTTGGGQPHPVHITPHFDPIEYDRRDRTVLGRHLNPTTLSRAAVVVDRRIRHAEQSGILRRKLDSNRDWSGSQ